MKRVAAMLLTVALALSSVRCATPAIAELAPVHPYGIPELDFVPTAMADAPDLVDYVRVNEMPSALGKVHFNGRPRTDLLDVEIVGPEVVFDPRDARHPLNRYDDLPNIATLTIAADRLILRAPLRLPRTDVTIHARTLVFEDVSGQQPASIVSITRPRDPALGQPARATRSKAWTPARTIFFPRQQRYSVRRGGNGAAGERSGNLTFFVGAIEERTDAGENPSGQRCRQVGSAGQNGGAALGGLYEGLGLPFLASQPDRGELHVFLGKLNAVSGGRPGVGGPTGELRTTIEIACDRTPAPGGTTAGAAGARGRGGDPWNRRRGVSVARRQGEAGPVTPVERLPLTADSGAHPSVLPPVVERIEDLYRAQRYDDARQVALRALDWAPIVSADEWEDDGTFLSARSRLFSMADGLASGLDYFGNPPGWVPMLSFEANYATYEAESRQAVRAMLMTHWLEQYWARQDQRSQVIAWSIEEQEAEVERLRDGIANAKRLLPGLERESDRIRGNVESFLAVLRANEDEMRRRLERETTVKNVVGVALTAIGTAASLLAFTNPGTAPLAVAAVAAGGNQALNSWGSGASGTSASDAFQAILDEDDIVAAREKFAQLDPYTTKSSGALHVELNRIGEDFSKATRRYVEQQMAASVASSADYNAEADLQAMLEADETFQTLFNNLVVLITKKQVFAEKLAETRAAIDQGAILLEETILSVSALQQALRDNESRIDRQSRDVLRTMRRNAKDRLVKYQYYLARSYEYRMLQPCPVDFEANRVYEHVESLFGLGGSSASKDVDLPLLDIESDLVDDLVMIYQADLRRIAELTVEGLEGERFDPVIGTYDLELNDAELAELNDRGRVEVDLSEHALIFEADRNARIVSVDIDSGRTEFDVRGDRGDQRAHVDVTIEPAERSFIRWHDATYAFNYRRPLYTNMVMWGYSWRAPEGPGRALRPSEESRSLMATLVDQRFGDQQRVRRVHFRPSAHGSIVIRKEVSATGDSIGVSVERLALSIDIEKTKSFAGASS